MDAVRRVMSEIGRWLGRLSATHRLLIGSLAVVALMALALAAVWSGRSEMVPLLPGAPPAEQQRVREYLDATSVRYTLAGETILVPAEERYFLLAKVMAAGQMPQDSSIIFQNLSEHQHWMNTKSQNDRIALIAQQNELARVISHFPGIEKASVFIDRPEPTGLGASARRPKAQVTVVTAGGASLSQANVDALAAAVSGSVAGLDPAEVLVIDAGKGRRYRATTDEEAGTTDYFEHVVKVERFIQDKLLDALHFIPNINVTVNASVEVGRSESVTQKVLPRGAGSETLLSSEMTSTETQASAAGAAEPGVRSNAQMDISRSGGGQNQFSSETTETRFSPSFGTQNVREVDPKGRPTAIRVAVTVPYEYVSEVVKRRAGRQDEPTFQEVEQYFDAEERGRLARLLRPLVATTATQAGAGAGAAAAAEDIEITMVPVSMAAAGLGGGGGAAGLVGAGTATVMGIPLGGGMVTTGVLGALALVSVALMLMMVRRASKRVDLPSPEELVGLPPALQPISDLVGEADETETAMAGIELDDSKIKSKKMLEEVTEMVKQRPADAAKLLNRWIVSDN